MNRAVLSVVVILFAALSCPADAAATNAATGVVAVAVATNVPAAKVPRQQCEAVTRSGGRCKRNAAHGAKLCRQHQKIEMKKAKELGCRE